MTEETALVPVVQQAPGRVYETSRLYARAHRLVSRLKREFLAVMRHPTGIADWYARLRQAYRYESQHQRRRFAVDTVSRKIARERTVNARTPADQRDYSQETTSIGAFLVQRRREHQVARQQRQDPWHEASQEIVTRAYTVSRNAQFMLSGQEGPLLP